MYYIDVECHTIVQSCSFDILQLYRSFRTLVVTRCNRSYVGKLSKFEPNKLFFYPQPKYGRHGLEHLQYAVNRSISAIHPVILSHVYSPNPVVLLYPCASLVISCHPLTRPFCNPVVLSYPCAFLVPSCHPLTRSFSNPVML